jgi:hypothetical protein
LLRLSGLKPIAYWTGLLFADYLLFLITAVLLTATAALIGLRVYQDDLLTFLVSFGVSGLAIIALSYLIGHLFDDKDRASRWNIFWQLVVGTGTPVVLLALLGSEGIGGVITFVFYLVSPMFTLYLTNLTVLVPYLNSIFEITVVDRLNVPTIFGSKATLGFSLGMYACQIVVYFALTVWLDHRKRLKYRVNDKNKEKI